MKRLQQVFFIIFVFAATTLCHAQTAVSGVVTTTTWTRSAGPYRVIDTVTVPTGNTLTIEAGIDVYFDVDVQFIVQGALRVHGTETDSVRFLPCEATEWGGIRISGGDSSSFEYTRISGGNADGEMPIGGGIFVEGSGTRLTMTNCVFKANRSTRGGGGIHAAYDCCVMLEDCRFIGNIVTGGGGGLFAISSSVVAVGCSFSDNVSLSGGGMCLGAHSSATLTECIFNGNSAVYGGGICVRCDSTVTLTDCTISDNNGSYGGGVSNSSEDTLTMTGCQISRNTAKYGGGVENHGTATLTRCVIEANSAVYGGGFDNNLTQATLTECLITGNSATIGGGIRNYHSLSNMTLTNSVLSGNSATKEGGAFWDSSGNAFLINCTIVGNSAATGAAFATSHWHSTMNNCILWGNSPDEISGGEIRVTYSCIQNGYPYAANLGFGSGTGLIDADPVFADPTNGDFSLLPGSPCIDAGDPELTDPDGSRSDMGAACYNGHVSVVTDHPLTFSLSQNRPNPFNPVTMIPYTVAQAGPVTLSVYNLQGQLVKTLVQETVQPGTHYTAWDGRDFTGRTVASGMYLYRINAPEGVKTQRMVLVR